MINICVIIALRLFHITTKKLALKKLTFLHETK